MKKMFILVIVAFISLKIEAQMPMTLGQFLQQQQQIYSQSQQMQKQMFENFMNGVNNGTIPVSVTPSTNSSQNDNNNTNSSEGTHMCNVCKGTGSMTRSWYVNTHYETYCNICKEKFYHGHSHERCTTCNGKGRW